MSDNLPRPTVLTPGVQARIVAAITTGSYLVTACDAAGISYRIFRHWQQRWESGDPVALEFDDFFHAIKKGSAVSEIDALDDLKRGEPGWQAKAWFLERRFAQRWGKKDQVTVTARDMTKLSDEELKAIAEGKGGG